MGALMASSFSTSTEACRRASCRSPAGRGGVGWGGRPVRSRDGTSAAFSHAQRGGAFAATFACSQPTLEPLEGALNLKVHQVGSQRSTREGQPACSQQSARRQPRPASSGVQCARSCERAS